MPKVSVIIPTYNRGYIVCEAVESALVQTFKDFELIIIDDGSTDDTAEKIRAIRDPRLRYFYQANRGLSGALNRGIAEARGEIIAFLDSDDLWEPEKLEREHSFFDEHPEVPGLFSDVGVRLGNGARIDSIARQSPGMLRFAHDVRERSGVISQRQLYLMLLQDVPIKPTALSIRKSTLAELGGFDLALRTAMDWDFLLRYAKRNPIGHVPEQLALMRHSGDSLHLETGASAVSLALLKRERQRIDPADHEALQSVRTGLALATRHVAWRLQRQGQPARAAAALLAGFVASRDGGLLARAVAALLPSSARTFAGRMRQGVMRRA